MNSLSGSSFFTSYPDSFAVFMGFRFHFLGSVGSFFVIPKSCMTINLIGHDRYNDSFLVFFSNFLCFSIFIVVSADPDLLRFILFTVPRIQRPCSGEPGAQPQPPPPCP